MAKIEPEILRRDIEDRLGEPVFFLSHVKTMLERLGVEFSNQTMISNLREGRVLPRDVDLDIREYGLNDDTRTFKASSVWAYLQRLEKRGEIDLGYSDMDDIIERNLQTYT